VKGVSWDGCPVWLEAAQVLVEGYFHPRPKQIPGNRLALLPFGNKINFLVSKLSNGILVSTSSQMEVGGLGILVVDLDDLGVLEIWVGITISSIPYTFCNMLLATHVATKP
jgi:hypothetical protein